MLSSIITRFSRSSVSLPLRKILRKARETYYNSEVLNRLERKTMAVPLRISAEQPRRINILIPEIDFASFFGGYIAKFNLAQKLAQRGHQVRIVMIDQCQEDPEVWKRCIGQYEGLENFHDSVEIVAHFDRDRELAVNPNDSIIATTWWSAHVAEQMRIELGQPRFIYLIQEYEPFTFPMGAWYAMAHASYSFPHVAMFSSELLMQYFQINGHGVFAGTLAQTRPTGTSTGNNSAISTDSDHSFAFENAIVRYTETDRVQARKRPRPPWKLLFYARPEAHASRNMFEIGYLALRQAVENGVFPAHQWEIHGVGTRHGDIDLGGGQTLKMLGKFGLEEYRETLLEYDVGLGLMYTPHPSLLPLEMAAAGMQVVTCECLNKDQPALARISPNMIAAAATIDGVANALAVAANKAREAGANTDDKTINWSNSWNETFDNSTLERIESWIA